jgi:hypothetical protein
MNKLPNFLKQKFAAALRFLRQPAETKAAEPDRSGEHLSWLLAPAGEQDWLAVLSAPSGGASEEASSALSPPAQPPAARD